MSDISLAQGRYALSLAAAAIRSDLHGEERISVSVAEEVPVAFRYNGFSHAVMMATPDDLCDFAFGFSLTEGLIDDMSGLGQIDIRRAEDGITLDLSLQADGLHRFLASRRVRQTRGHTSCGLCGIEDLQDVAQPPRRVATGRPLDTKAVQSAVAALRHSQPLSLCTRAAHASAWISPSGTIVAVREDIGRHNSLDKLIGAGLRGGFDCTEGFCLITSRCSFEMAQKAIAAGFTTLVSVSAPTALAIRTAAAAGLTLCSIGRNAGHFLYTAPFLSHDNRHVDEA